MSELAGFADGCAPRNREAFETYPGRPMTLGTMPIWRALPVRNRRLIGAWCFLDRYGPLTFTDGKPMDVAPHPHIGLQTVSWLLSGEVVHHDSLGCEAVVTPGGVNVMTSGSGIAHTEETPRRNGGTLNGVQLWIALPDAVRNTAPSLQHVAEVPVVEWRGGSARLFIGELAGTLAPAERHSELVGAELQLHAHEPLEVPVVAAHEHGVYLLEGDATFAGQQLELNTLYYVGCGRSELPLQSRDGARLLLIGGAPFNEPVLMWWNFVARQPEEIAAARADWQARRRFGDVPTYDGPRIEAPMLSRLARPNPAS